MFRRMDIKEYPYYMYIVVKFSMYLQMFPKKYYLKDINKNIMKKHKN